MKTWLSLVLVILAILTTARAQTPVLESQKLAIAKYPDLADGKSKFNQKFLAMVVAQRASDASFLQRDDWPMVIADRTAAALDVKPAANTDGPNHSATLDAPVGRITIHGSVMQKMDTGLLLNTIHGVVLLRGYAAKEGATITVPTMKAEPYDYTDLDGAKRRVDSYQALK
ncbi:MAG: hypothetical protein ABJF10_07370 [Chthoniobacter sp.]|uniref:hypothetical protein n=1 Tax=Chthoniobacter sp. TaxID=2510640 RepID=UPI0032A8BC3A